MKCYNRMCGIWSHDQSGKELCCMTCEHVMNDHESKTYSGKVLSLLTRIADGLEKGAKDDRISVPKLTTPEVDKEAVEFELSKEIACKYGGLCGVECAITFSCMHPDMPESGSACVIRYGGKQYQCALYEPEEEK